MVNNMAKGRWKRWSKNEDGAVLLLKASGASIQHIAEELGRSAASIDSRISYLKRKQRLHSQTMLQTAKSVARAKQDKLDSQ